MTLAFINFKHFENSESFQFALNDTQAYESFFSYLRQKIKGIGTMTQNLKAHSLESKSYAAIVPNHFRYHFTKI